MTAQYNRLLKLYALLNELLPEAVVYNPYRRVIERIGQRYTPQLKHLFYLLLEAVARMHQVHSVVGKHKAAHLQVTRNDMILVLSLMKDLLAPPKADNHISSGAIDSYSVLLQHEEGLSMKQLALKRGIPSETIKAHLIALHKQGYTTRQWQQGKRQKYYIHKAVMVN
jgi:hypothetical protein